MKTFGFALLLAGVVGLCTTLGVVGTLVWDAWSVHKAYRGPLVVGEELVTEPFTVRDDAMLQVGVRARIEAKADLTGPRETFDDTDYDLLYEFPLEYDVLFADDERDGDLVAEDGAAIDGGFHTVTHSRQFVRRDGGWIHGTFWFRKIEPPEGLERVRVRIRVDPDTTTHARIEQTELIVADDAKPVLMRVAIAVVAGVLAVLSFVGGALCILFGSNPPSRDDEFEPTTA